MVVPGLPRERPGMSAPGREAKIDYSKAPGGLPHAGPRLAAARLLLVAVALAGAAALIVATFTTVIEIKVGVASDLIGHKSKFTGMDRHSVALLLIAAVAIVLALGAARGVRPAIAGLALTGVAALIVAIAIDLPDLHKTGIIGRVYAAASAGPGGGYYAETLGGVLLVLAGGALFMLQAAPRTLGEVAGPASREAPLGEP